jgi:hypothetical protein
VLIQEIARLRYKVPYPESESVAKVNGSGLSRPGFNSSHRDKKREPIETSPVELRHLAFPSNTQTPPEIPVGVGHRPTASGFVAALRQRRVIEL